MFKKTVESESEDGLSILAVDSISGKKTHIFHFAGYFALLVDGFRCGYARFKGAVHTFSEHQKNKKY